MYPTSAREEMLQTIRGSLSREVKPDVNYSHGTPLAHGPGTASAHSQLNNGGNLSQILLNALSDYKAKVMVFPEEEISGAIADVVKSLGLSTLIFPEGLAHTWLEKIRSVRLVTDHDGLSNRDLSEIEGVVTGCSVAIAESGTIILTGRPDEGRRALTLLPDFHICVVRKSDIVSTVGEAIARVDPTSPITLISGPSATSDIELKRVEGVHGPRNLSVIIAS